MPELPASTVKFLEGLVTSIAARVAAVVALATGTFLWQFAGHVAADVIAHLAPIVAGN